MKIIKPPADFQYRKFRWYLKEIGCRLKQARISQNLAVTTVTERLKLPAGKILEIESGKNDFELDLLITLCQLYEANIQEVLSLFTNRRDNLQ